MYMKIIITFTTYFIRMKTIITILKIITINLILLFIFDNNLRAQTTEKFLIGNWMGKIDIQGTKLSVVIRFNFNEKDSLIAVMDSPDQGAKDIPVSKLTLRNDSVFIRLKQLNVTIGGLLNKKDSTINGTFKQSIVSCPLILKKVEKVPTLNRPQEPKPPYPYKVTEVSFKNTKDSITLAGTLTLPEKGDKFPVVIMITGSGPQNRDEELLGHKPFLVIADYLTRQGIAVLRYDDRGIGKSKGDFTKATSFDFANDVEAAINYLKQHPNIDVTKIGLIGHSEGGLIAPIVASRNKDVNFIVLLAGPGLSGYQIILKQSALISRAEGTDEKTIKDNNKFSEKIYKILKDEPDNTKAGKEIKEYYLKEIKKLSKEEKEKSGLSEANADIMITQVTSKWFRTFLFTDPQPYLSKVKCAVLALNGEKDLQVPPDEDLAAIESALKKAGNTNYKTLKLPGLNHLFQHCTNGSPSEYSTIEETISPEVLKIISEWIHRTVIQGMIIED